MWNIYLITWPRKRGGISFHWVFFLLFKRNYIEHVEFLQSLLPQNALYNLIITLVKILSLAPILEILVPPLSLVNGWPLIIRDDLNSKVRYICCQLSLERTEHHIVMTSKTWNADKLSFVCSALLSPWQLFFSSYDCRLEIYLQATTAPHNTRLNSYFLPQSQ